MSSFRSKVLSLYRNLIRESKKFNSYSYRKYALEKVNYEFRENRNVTDAGKLSQLIKKAEENLQMIKRQVIVGQLYGEGHLVIEHHQGKKG
ncbi:hypothetical protein CHS0354_011970 [Potamilus streckersoni]|uniref:Complex 1 LYR protein domain-containing protein n=1 Tax=Potamilus streckersoni TaxID=2493646 RepID=A0AAE0TG81_9BIVA|nr:hypothetical protein CHS0354_011970 [Potamilus streckersoni]